MSLSKQRRNQTNFPNSVFGPLNTISPITNNNEITISVEKITPLLPQYITTEDDIIISTESSQRIITE